MTRKMAAVVNPQGVDPAVLAQDQEVGPARRQGHRLGPRPKGTTPKPTFPWWLQFTSPSPQNPKGRV